MSFGFSPTDIVTLVSLTTKAYQGWRNACGEYGDITNTLFSFQIVLKRVHRHVQNPDQEDARPFLADENTLSNDLQLVLSSSNRTVGELQNIVRKYPSLNTDRKSNWERIRLGCENLQSLQGRLSRDLNLISTLLLDVVLESVDLCRQDVSNISSTIKGGLPVALENLVENKSTDSASAFTTYEQDSKEVWRELRREMIRLGFKSDDVSANKGALLAFARSLVSDEDPEHDPSYIGQENGSSVQNDDTNKPSATDKGQDFYADRRPSTPTSHILPEQGTSQQPKNSHRRHRRIRREYRSIPERSRDCPLPSTTPLRKFDHPGPSGSKKYQNGDSLPNASRNGENNAFNGGSSTTAFTNHSSQQNHPRRPPPSTSDPSISTGPKLDYSKATQKTLGLTYQPISPTEDSPVFVHLCLPLGWTVLVHPNTSVVSFKDLLAGKNEPMNFSLPPMVWPEETINALGWTTLVSNTGRVSWRALQTGNHEGALRVRYTHPSMLDDKPHSRCLIKEWGQTYQDAKHRLDDVNGCFRVDGSFFTDFTVENPCQVLEWTWEMHMANPNLLNKLREWSALKQPTLEES